VFTPDTAQSGAYQVTFTASDGVLTDTEIITITVTETAHQPPVLDSLGPKSVDEGQTLSFKVTASDPDGAFPALMVLNKPANASFADSGNGTGGFTFAPSFTQAGPYNVTFIASDGSLADSETVHITVDNVNRPPVLDSIGPQNVVVGNILSLRLSATDQDGTIPSLYAYQLPLNSVFEDSGNGRGSFVFAPETSQVADYYVSFVAGDGFLEDTSVVGISVTAAACVAMPGDANASGTYTLGDAIAMVNYIFGKPGCSPTPLCWLSGLLCRGDWNASNSVTLGDVIQAVNYLFNKPGGPWTPVPTGVCCQTANR
jgi:PKD repeat protein